MRKTKLFGVLTVVLICLAVIFFSDLPKVLKYQRGEVRDFNSVGFGELEKGDLVQGVIDDTDGYIAEMEETNTTFGIPTSTHTSKRYYALYTVNHTYVLYATGRESDYDTLDKLAQESAAYYDNLEELYHAQGEDADFASVALPETMLEFTGEVEEMPDDLRKIFMEWYGDGFAQDCEANIVIQTSNFGRFSWVLYAGAGCAVLAVVMLVLTILSLRKEKRDQQYGY